MTRSDPTDRSRRMIEDNLRRAYGQIVTEGVPDRFRDVLERLRENGHDRSPRDASEPEPTDDGSDGGAA